MIARIGVSAAAVVVATGGLAAAGAVPARVKDAISHLGITTPAHHGPDGPPAGHTTTTMIAGATENRRGDPSGATRGTSSVPCGQTADENDSLSGSCGPTPTIAAGITPTTVGDNNDSATPTTSETDGTPTPTTGAGGDNNGDTTPTTIERDATPTTVDNSEADPNSSLSVNTGPVSSDDTKPSPMGDN
jgi:hypothetical protein